MNYYRARLQMAGPVAGQDPWQADTLFGHLCWALRYTRGEEALRAFLQDYDEAARDGGEPPLVLSNGFPGDYLPKPAHVGLAPLRPPAEALEKTGEADPARAEMAYHRAVRARRFLSRQEFEQVRMGRGPAALHDPHGLVDRRANLKNQIDRLTYTAGGEAGQLFAVEETFIPEVTVYCAVAEGYQDLVADLFQYLVLFGYGKRKVVGYGQVKAVNFAPFEGFPQVDGADAFVSLSNFVPAPQDPARGWWESLVKYGKLGEEYTFSANPFKRPVVVLRAGAVLADPDPRPFYGRMVKNVAPALPQVVQYGLALAVPLWVPSEE